MVDIAARVWNHKWKIDPIVRSLIDTDFYKLLMCQSIYRNKSQTNVTFSLINRSSNILLADLVDEGELREQLDHIRSLSLTRGESTWLRGNTFYGRRQMFRSDFMEWFEGLRLPAYHLEKINGQYELTFEGNWPEVMLWEVPALSVLMELRSRAVLDAMYAAANKVDNLIATIDFNGRQIDGDVENVLSLGSLSEKWQAFGWEVLEMDGHNFENIHSTMTEAKNKLGRGKPVVIIMATEMGMGVDFMMGTHKWHGVAPNDEQLSSALSQIKETLGDY